MELLGFRSIGCGFDSMDLKENLKLRLSLQMAFIANHTAKACMTFKLFEKQKYLNIETFRKNGQGVKTPVLFAPEGELLYIWTQAGSGKVKRLRNNGSARIAPATVFGQPLGDWLLVYARTDERPEAIKHVKQLLAKKYGIFFYFVCFLVRIRGGSKFTTLQIQAQPPFDH